MYDTILIMEQTQKMITYELRLRRKNIINKAVLGTFLAIAVGTLLLRIITGALLDAGLVGGKFHVGYWADPQKAFASEYATWAHTHGDLPIADGWHTFLKENDPIHTIILRHPNTVWFLTQFTWLTTIIIIMYVTFRFFRFDDTVPRWLRWIMTQRTLSLVVMYDMVVGIVFWASMFKGFAGNFSDSLFGVELTITILVHSVIPLFILIYSIIFLIKDKKASALTELFAFKGLIYPAIYMMYYIVLTIVWNDPYPITNMHARLTTDLHSGVLLPEPNFGSWASQLYLVPLVLLAIYVILGVMTLLHNVILHKFNKKYDPEHDYAVIKRKEHKLERISRKLIHKEARNWRNLND